MSKKFLEQLLRTENRALFDTGPNCEICLQPLGELSSETGVIECGIRLPCDHVFGSACIATWLRSNNSCPMCRQVLFKPNPYQEPGATGHHGEEDEDEPPNLADLCLAYARELRLSVTLGEIVVEMAGDLWSRPEWNLVHTERCTAAIALYVTSHLAGQARSADDVSFASYIGAGHILWTYRDLFERRQELVPIPRELLVQIAWKNIRKFLYTMPAPEVVNKTDQDNDRAGRNIGSRDGDSSGEYGTIAQRPSEPAEQLCENICAELGLDGHAEDIAWLIAGDTSRMLAEGFMSKVSLAVGIFMASHLVGTPRTVTEVSTVSGADDKAMKRTYEDVYPSRRDVVGLEVIQIMAMRNSVRVYEILPPLAWPAP